MTAICPVCESGDTAIQAKYRSDNHIFDEINRILCRECGMVFAAPLPTAKDLEIFNSNYYEAAHGGQATHKSARAFFSGIALLRIAHLQRYLTKHKTTVSRILELGPGPGYFAQHWLNYEPNSSYYAIETDVTLHDTLKELGVQLLGISDEDTRPDLLDLVVMSHVLEHIPNPREFLEQATNKLKTGGALFIEVPCRDFEHKLIDAPHLLFFDKLPMTHLLANLGFTLIEVSYHGKLITDLRSTTPTQAMWQKVRAKLIRLGLVSPFSRTHLGMEPVVDPYARAVIAPFQAHRESHNPAWWLRAVALKS